jgi:cell shape-determining protein MreC
MLLIALALFALAPASLTGWVKAARNPLETALIPVSDPVSSLLARAREPATEADPRVTDLEQQVEQERLLRAQAEQRIGQLRAMVRDLQAGLTIAPDAPARSVWASIVGYSPDPREGLIIAGRGARHGVVEGQTVALARGVHLVGRVVDVNTRTSRIMPITHFRAGYIGAMVMTSDPTFGYEAQLLPEGDGTLLGELVAEAEGVEEGQIVRLRDDAWPATSQMVVIGRVVEVGRKENQRLTVRVAPELNVARVSTVVLRIPMDPGEAEAGEPEAGS